MSVDLKPPALGVFPLFPLCETYVELYPKRSHQTLNRLTCEKPCMRLQPIQQ